MLESELQPLLNSAFLRTPSSIPKYSSKDTVNAIILASALLMWLGNRKLKIHPNTLGLM